MDNLSVIIDVLLLVFAVIVVFKLVSAFGKDEEGDVHTRTNMNPVVKASVFPSKPVSKDVSLSPQNDLGYTVTVESKLLNAPDEEIFNDAVAHELFLLEGVGDTTQEKESLLAGMRAIRAQDMSFLPQSFLELSKLVYEEVTTAFATGAQDKLSKFLSPALFALFQKSLMDRISKKQTMTRSFVGVHSAKIKALGCEAKELCVTIVFVAEMTHMVQNEEGIVVEGDPVTLRKTRDTWTFTRNALDRKSGWLLTQTQ